MSKTNPLSKAVTLAELCAIKARGEAIGATSMLEEINQLAAAGHPLFIQVTVPSAVLKDIGGEESGIALMVANTQVNVDVDAMCELVKEDTNDGFAARLLGATTSIPFIVAHAINRAISNGDKEVVEHIMELAEVLRDYLGNDEAVPTKLH